MAEIDDRLRDIERTLFGDERAQQKGVLFVIYQNQQLILDLQRQRREDEVRLQAVATAAAKQSATDDARWRGVSRLALALGTILTLVNLINIVLQVMQ